MTLGFLLLYPLESFGSIGEANIGIHLMDASAIHIDDVPDIKVFRNTSVTISDCLSVYVKVAVFFNIHCLMPSNSVRAHTYLIQSPYVERPICRMRF